MNTRMFAAVLMAVAACLTITALANGRKPVASVAVKAVVETSAGTNEIFNVRLASGTNELMEFEAKNGPVKQIIKLSMVNKIAFIEASRANTNYAVFEVFLNATNISKKFEFKVMDNGNPLNLKGTTPDRTTFEVLLVDCQSVQFSPQGELHKDPSWPVHTGATAR